MTADGQAITQGWASGGAPIWVRAIERVVHGMATFVGVLIVLMGLTITFDVASRNLLNQPLTGTFEMVTYVWMPAIAMMALPLAQLLNEQIGVNLLTDFASRRMLPVLSIGAEIVTMGIALWITRLGMDTVRMSFALSETTSVVTWVYLWPGKLAVLLSYLMLAAAAIVRIYNLLRSPARDAVK